MTKPLWVVPQNTRHSALNGECQTSDFPAGTCLEEQNKEIRRVSVRLGGGGLGAQFVFPQLLAPHGELFPLSVCVELTGRPCSLTSMRPYSFRISFLKRIEHRSANGCSVLTHWKDSDGLWASLHANTCTYICTSTICSVWWTVCAFFWGSCQWYTNLSVHRLHLYSCFVTHTVRVCVCASMSMPSESSFVDLACSQSLVRNPCSSPVHLHGHGEEAEFEPVCFP